MGAVGNGAGNAKNILFEAGAGEHEIDCSLTTFPSLIMIGLGAQPGSMIGVGDGLWFSLPSRLGAGPTGTTISAHSPATDGNWTKSGPHASPGAMT